MNHSLILSTAFAFFLTVSAFAGKPYYMKHVHTIAPNVPLYGPIKDTMDGKEYKTKIFRIIMEESHHLASDYLKAKDYKAYWSFLIASLTVPLHEGGNIHFIRTENDGSVCDERSNSGDLVRSYSTYNHAFKKLFKRPRRTILPPCKTFEDQRELHLLYRSGDGFDLGIMQINMYWHEEKHYSPGHWRSVRLAVRYGLNHLMIGFKEIYANSRQYSCIRNGNKINYYNLIRGSWAGKYNSGNVSNTCRFTNNRSEWRLNDVNFKKNLDLILSLDNYLNRQRYYNMEDEEEEVLSQLVTNFKKGAAAPNLIINYLNLRELADTDVVQVLDKTENTIDPSELKTDRRVNDSDFNPTRTYQVTTASLNFREDPEVKTNNLCGSLSKGTQVKVKGQTGDWYELDKDGLDSFYQNNHNCNFWKKRYAHSSYLSDLGPLHDEVAQTKTKLNSGETANSERKVGELTSWVWLREDRPNGTEMAPKVEMVGPAKTEVTIINTVWNSANSSHPWYQISHPANGWVYGRYLKVKGQ